MGSGGRWPAALLIALSAGCSGAADRADRDVRRPEPRGVIAFDLVPEDSENGHVHTMQVDGTEMARANTGSPAESNPAWSPDGLKLAFARVTGEDRSDIFVTEIAREDASRITSGPGGGVSPTWSPDGDRIAFSRGYLGRVGPGRPPAEIWVIDADGTSETRLTRNDAIDATPDWSPDGSTIAFSSDRGDSADIWTMTPTGDGETQITETPEGDVSPAWSPDGRRIAFSRGGAAGSDLYVMNPDGSDVRLITDEVEYVGEIDWSPDGDWIAFTGVDDEERVAIYLIRPGGTDLRRISRTGDKYYAPAWRPT